MVASVPDSEAIIPLRSRRSRANQLAAEPESLVMMQPSGRREDSSQKTRWGLTGLASTIARDSTSRHHSRTSPVMRSCQERSALRSSSGSSARRVSALSPTSGTSVG
jgi:hypothetical protein